MKSIIGIFCSISLTLSLQAQFIINPYRFGGGGGGGGPSYLVNQGFEGTGYDNSETWTEVLGTPDEDDTTTPPSGVQSLYMDGSSTSQMTEINAGSAQAEFYVTFLYRPVSYASGNRIIFGASNTSNGTTRYSIQVTSTGQLLASRNGGSTANTTATMSTGTTYLIGGYYKNSTQEIRVSFVAAGGSLPTSGTANYATATAGSAGTSPQYFSCRQPNSTASGGSGRFDDVKVSTTNIWP